MSGESTPMLNGAVPAFKHFISQWEQLIEIASYCALYIHVGLE